MTETTAPAMIAEPSVRQQTPGDTLDRLTRFGWSGGLALIIGALALSFFAAGYFVIYYRNADMDFMVVYNALVLNDGKPQVYFDHPGYLTILSVEYWFRLLHHLDLLRAWQLPAIPPATNRAGFDTAMTEAVRAGRIVAWLTATAFVAAFAFLSRRIFKDWRVALLATFAFAFSGGIAVHMRILRTEMIAAGLVILAFLVLIAAARKSSLWRPLWMGVAAALCVLGLENKVQAILLISALPLLILPLGEPAAASVEFWRISRKSALACAAAAVLAAICLWLAMPVFRAGLDPDMIARLGLHPVIAGQIGLYQPALAAFIGAAMIVFAVLWRVGSLETLASMLAMIAGGALALLVLTIEWNPANAAAVLNPIERMVSFADLGNAPETSSFGGLVALAFDSLLFALKRWTFVLASSPRPTVFLIWVILPGIWLAARRGAYRLAFQVTLLLLAALAIDTLGVRRGLKPEYIIFTDPLIIIAGALLLEAMPDVALRKWAWPIGVALFATQIAVSQAEPVKHVFKTSGPEYICEWSDFYEPLMPMPYCSPPPHP